MHTKQLQFRVSNLAGPKKRRWNILATLQSGATRQSLVWDAIKALNDTLFDFRIISAKGIEIRYFSALEEKRKLNPSYPNPKQKDPTATGCEAPNLI